MQRHSDVGRGKRDVTRLVAVSQNDNFPVTESLQLQLPAVGGLQPESNKRAERNSVSPSARPAGAPNPPYR
jgi:hypothetical protein